MTEPQRPARIFPGGAPDQETFDLMNRLDDLQTWTLLMTTHGAPKAREAMTLVQDVRCFIVERLYPNAIRSRTMGVDR